jgi:hypothetical protein
MIRYADRVFLHQQSRWFIWEPSWKLYRPIDGLRWTGTELRLEDHAYCKDPLDDLYGFGTDRMYTLCFNLSQNFADVENAKALPFLTIGTPEWFRDRPLALTPCAPRTVESWKRMNLKRRTVRSCLRKTFTKRNMK